MIRSGTAKWDNKQNAEVSLDVVHVMLVVEYN